MGPAAGALTEVASGETNLLVGGGPAAFRDAAAGGVGEATGSDVAMFATCVTIKQRHKAAKAKK